MARATTRRLNAVLLALVLVGLPLFAAAQQAGSGFAVIAVKRDPLALYAGSKGKAKVAKVPAGEVVLPLPVLEEAESGRLKVQIGEVTGWLKSRHVETNEMRESVAVCEESGPSQRVPGSRMIGERCKQ